MNHFRAALLAAPLLLAGCNTSDVLIPREEIGAGTGTTPVTQEDTGRMARNPPQQPPQQGTAAYQPLPPPQNTLEAQARALQDGASVSPAASPPLAEAPSQDAADTPAPPAAAAASEQVASLPPATAAEATTIRFLPIIGAPVQAVTPLSRRLGAEARSNGLTIRSTGDADAEHVLKGYLSAYADGGQVNVVYVWDVLDAEGVRLHRIQGQESVQGSGPDPWASVPAGTMETIGTRTIASYREWLAARRG
ncbi:hypothetical protein NOF55_05590 [Rhizobiaceae bacterium BDR2-2]|uniref:Lipoprotein n=1 Tax=Ectorhizobium quercum TaxID=2965071 RepID=A0AAE3N0G2_9HYPH|nr:hypothetical protein [Ectorhizobium quercum]MCX8996572.1 hypothetical protein [Ectorhizobium quercum]